MTKFDCPHCDRTFDDLVGYEDHRSRIKLRERLNKYEPALLEHPGQFAEICRFSSRAAAEAAARATRRWFPDLQLMPAKKQGLGWWVVAAGRTASQRAKEANKAKKGSGS